MNRKGFIGPLGDDIPSIFPIVFAVLLFTGTILYANGLIAQKAKLLEIREGALSLSYLVTEKGYVEKLPSNPNGYPTSLAQACEEKVKPLAASKGVKYLITLKRFCKGVPSDYDSGDPRFNPYASLIPASQDEFPSGPFYIDRSQKDGSTWDYCTNDQDYASLPLGTDLGNLVDSAVLTFPIAVPCDPDNLNSDQSFTNGLGVINVITWK